MNKIFNLKNIIIITTLITILLSLVNNVKAAVVDYKKKAKLTIVSYEHSNLSMKNKALNGVEFSLYYVPENIETVEDAEEYIKSNSVTTYAQTTQENGKVVFSELELGRYFVVQTKSPKNVAKRTDSFLIDLPTTTVDGVEYIYDVVIYPKTYSIYGSMVLNKKTNDNNPLEGTEWKLQKYEQEEWVDYEYDGNLTTNVNGKLELQNLEVGKYRIYETKTKEGYILDESKKVEFTIDMDNPKYKCDAINEKPSIDKFVLLDNGQYGKNSGKYKKDKTKWKVEADIPSMITKMKTYCITETLQEGLNADDQSINVEVTDNQNQKENLTNDKYSITKDNNQMTINFNTQYLENMKKVEITYNTSFSEEVTNGDFSNSSSLKYTNKIANEERQTEESTYTTENVVAKVHTGSVLVKKIDDHEVALEGAKFKIAESKSKAEQGIFLSDENHSELVAISDSLGYVTFNGLKYGEGDQTAEEASTSYWLVEVESPTYIEDGETLHYKLQNKPIEIKVNNNSHIYSKGTTVEVINKKMLELPLTGKTFLWVLIPIILGVLTILKSYKLIKKRKLQK